MKKKNNNDELISRRQFFKKAAGLVLPVAVTVEVVREIVTLCVQDIVHQRVRHQLLMYLTVVTQAVKVHAIALARVHAHERISINGLMEIKEQYAGWQSGMDKNITFIVTKDCQLACKYCYLVGKNTKCSVEIIIGSTPIASHSLPMALITMKRKYRISSRKIKNI